MVNNITFVNVIYHFYISCKSGAPLIHLERQANQVLIDGTACEIALKFK